MNKLKNIDIMRVTTLFNLLKNTFEQSYNKINESSGLRIYIPKAVENEIFRAILAHYNDHARLYRLEVTEACPYKILAWGSYLFADRMYILGDDESKTFAVQILSAGIVTMLKILRKEGVELETNFHKKALFMVLREIEAGKNEKHQDLKRFGLGMNGFYMMFRTASMCGVCVLQ